ncbi:uncharacterized protein K460DRAFT_387813 [Cucurbitaria berberidis CBS 394.84]|uniref:Insecticidal crystal toxin domain-containing protein n=1 Tax=Cucurbitaria berberidis CBS 394.84 TaxID=1168544 RepID=A0A9P4L714_9PLEO|nr:uncharacterized protein K460DRAFT_387813 [Cucurbitaria berberidis CBS 394.84]KAF1843859.1 hypothetical protein K460DRAFT_387813 [Cucurbitaria berberidis CBS 394.84]
MPNETRDYGNLRVTLTKDFDWVYNDKGSGAKLNGSFIHAKSQGDLRPLGTYAYAGFDDQSNKRATLLVGNVPNGSGTPAVASPTSYTMMWDARSSESNNDGSIWKANAPSGYVALGDICVNNYASPSTNAMWCVRSDLALQSEFSPDCIWSDSYSKDKTDVSIWPILSPPANTEGSDHIPAINDLFIASTTYNQPDYSRAKFLVLPYPNDFKRFTADLPTFTKDTIPHEGDIFAETPQCAVVLPFTAFFPATDTPSLERIQHPFVTLQRRTAWYVEDVARNAADEPMTQATTITKGVSETQSQEMTNSAGVEISASKGIRLIKGEIEASLNYQFTATESSSTTEYSEVTKTHTYTIGPQTVAVILTDRAWIQAIRSDGSITFQEISFNASDDMSRTEIKLT